MLAFATPTPRVSFRSATRGVAASCYAGYDARARFSSLSTRPDLEHWSLFVKDVRFLFHPFPSCYYMCLH